jgi:hypothetical protein
LQCVRARISQEYQLTSEKQVLFSQDERYLALAFPLANRTVVLDLKHAYDIKTIKLTKSLFINQPGEIFRFVDEITAVKQNSNAATKLNEDGQFIKPETVTKSRYLVINDYSASLDSNVIKVYDLTHMIFLNGGQYGTGYYPLHFEIERTEDLRRLKQITTYLGSIDDYQKRRQTGVIRTVRVALETSEDIPFSTIIKANFYKYFEAKEMKNSQSEQFYLDCITNCIKCLKEEQIMADIRVPYIIFNLNKPGLMESAFFGRVDLNTLFGVHNMLYVAFRTELSYKTNSINSISVMFDNYVKAKKYPKIDEDCIQEVLSNENKVIENCMDSRSILSHVIFSDCHTVVTGLVENRYKSLTTLKDEEGKQSTLPISLIQGRISQIMVKKPKKATEYQVFRSRVKLNLRNGSKSSLGIFRAIQLMSDDEIRYKYKQLIYYKWNLVYWYSLAYTLIYIVLNVLAYIYFGFNSILPIGLAIILLNGFFIFYDFKCFGAEWRQFLKDANNLVDVLVHSVSILSVIVIEISAFRSLHPYVKLVAITGISVRGITLLRMFGPLRMFIYLIGQVIIDLLWVPPVLIIILILAGTLYKVAPLPGGNLNTELTFFKAMQQAFFLVFMPTQADQSTVADRGEISSIIRSIIVVVGGTIIAQGIFNFIIAIFLQTFRKVTTDKEIYEIRALILEIRYIDLFLRGFHRCTSPEEHYYLFLVQVPKDGQLIENQTNFDKAHLVVDNLVGELAKRGFKKIEAKAKEVLPDQHKIIEGAVDGIMATGKETDKNIKAIIDVGSKIAKGFPPTQEDFKTILDNAQQIIKKEEDVVLIQKLTTNIEKAEEHGKKYDKSNDIQISEVLDLLATMVEVSGPEYRSYAAKIRHLDKLIESFQKCAKLAEQGNLNILRDLIPEVGKNAEVFITKEIGEGITKTGEFVSKIIVEGEEIFKKDKDINFVQLVQVFSQFIKDLFKKEIELNEGVVDILNLFSTVTSKIKSEIRGGDVRMKTIIELVKLIYGKYPDQSLKEPIYKVLDILQYLVENWPQVKAKLHSIKASDFKEITIDSNILTELVEYSKQILAMIGKEEYIEMVKDYLPIIHAFEESINFYHRQQVAEQNSKDKANEQGVLAKYDKFIKIHKIIPHFRPLMTNTFHLDSKIFDCVSSAIKLIELSISGRKGLSEVDIPGMVGCIKTIVIICTDKKNLETHFLKLETGSIIVQSALNNGSYNEEVVCKSALEMVCLFDQSYKARSERISKLLASMLRQVRMIALKEDYNVEQFITDATDLLEISVGEGNTKLVTVTKNICSVVRTAIPNLKKVNKDSIKHYCKIAGETIAIIEPLSRKFSDLACHVVDFVEHIVVHHKRSSPETYIQMAGNVYSTFAPKQIQKSNEKQEPKQIQNPNEVKQRPTVNNDDAIKSTLKNVEKIQSILKQNSSWTQENFDSKIEDLFDLLEPYCSNFTSKTKDSVTKAIKLMKDVIFSPKVSLKDINSDFDKIIETVIEVLSKLFTSSASTFQDTNHSKIAKEVFETMKKIINEVSEFNLKKIEFASNAASLVKTDKLSEEAPETKTELSSTVKFLIENGIKVLKLLCKKLSKDHEEKLIEMITTGVELFEKIAKKEYKDPAIYIDAVKSAVDIIDPDLKDETLKFKNISSQVLVLIDKGKNLGLNELDKVLTLTSECLEIFDPILNIRFNSILKTFIEMMTLIYNLSDQISIFKNKEKAYEDPELYLTMVKLAKPVVLCVKPSYSEGYEVVESILTSLFSKEDKLLEKFTRKSDFEFNLSDFFEGFTKIISNLSKVKGLTEIGQYVQPVKIMVEKISIFIEKNNPLDEDNLREHKYSTLSELLYIFGFMVDTICPNLKPGIESITEIAAMAERAGIDIDHNELGDTERVIGAFLKIIAKGRPGWARHTAKIMQKVKDIVEITNAEEDRIAKAKKSADLTTPNSAGTEQVTGIVIDLGEVKTLLEIVLSKIIKDENPKEPTSKDSISKEVILKEVILKSILDTIECMNKVLIEASTDGTLRLSSITSILSELPDPIGTYAKEIHRVALAIESENGKGVEEIVSLASRISTASGLQLPIESDRIVNLVESVKTLLSTPLDISSDWKVILQTIEGQASQPDKQKETSQAEKEKEAMRTLTNKNMEALSEIAFELLGLLLPRAKTQIRDVHAHIQRLLKCGLPTTADPSSLEPLLSILQPQALTYLPLAEDMHTVFNEMNDNTAGLGGILDLIGGMIGWKVELYSFVKQLRRFVGFLNYILDQDQSENVDLIFDFLYIPNLMPEEFKSTIVTGDSARTLYRAFKVLEMCSSGKEAEQLYIGLVEDNNK